MKQKDALILACDCIYKVWNIEYAEAKEKRYDYTFSQRDKELSEAKVTLEKVIKYLETL